MKKYSLNQFQIENLSNQVFQAGEITNPQMLKESVQKAVSSKKAKLAFGVGGASVMAKKITIPKMSEELIPEQIRWEAEQYIPFNIDEVNIDYVLLGPSPKQKDSMDILLVALQQEKLRQYMSVLESAGFQAELVDVNSFALANCFFVNYPEYESSLVGLIDVGASYTNFVIIKNNMVIYVRDLPYGGNRFNEELAKNLSVSVAEAEQIKRSGKEMPDIAYDTIQSVARTFSEQILGSAEFFVESEKEEAVSRYFVTGGASLTLGLVDSLAQILGKPVEYLDVFKRIQLGAKVLKTNAEIDLQYRSAVAVGLSLRGCSHDKD